MLTIAVRGVRSHFVRFGLSVLAVLLGVGFVAGTFSLRGMMAATFDELVDTAAAGDAYLRGPEHDGAASQAVSGLGSTRDPIPAALAAEAERVDGVARAMPMPEGPVVLVGADDTAVLNSQAPSFGTPLYPDEPAVTIVQGRAPERPGEIALEAATFAASGLAVGDRTTFVLGGEVTEVEVVGEVDIGAAVAGATVVFLDPDTAMAAFAPDGLVPSITVLAADGVSEEQVRDRLAGALDGPVEVVTGAELRAESKAEIAEMLGFVETFLLVFASIALFVGAFIISNTFAMSVRQRQREFALLRAIGASPTQVFGSVLGQAAVVGLVGSALGVGAGIGLVGALRVVFEQVGMELAGQIPVDGFTITVSVLTGLVMSLLAAAVPARHAALTPPVEAMRDDAVAQDRSLALRGWIGGLLTAAGVAAVVAATRADDGEMLLALGAPAVVLGALLVAPVLARWVIGVLAAPFVATIRPLGRLARGNVMRNPRRTTNTAGALMIGMALVGAASVLAASMQESVRTIVGEEAAADLIVQSATPSLPGGAVDGIREIAAAERVDVLTGGFVVADDERTMVAGFPADGMGASLTPPVVEGTLDALAAGEVAVQLSAAEQHGWALGDVVGVETADGTRDLRIGAILDSRALGIPLLVSTEVFDELAPMQAEPYVIFLTAGPGSTVEELRSAVTDVISPFVVLSVVDGEEFAAELADQVDQMLVIVYALLGLSIVIAVLGIINTLALSVIERTREIGLLRAVGLGRLQLSGTVTIESVLTAVFGTVLGLAVGVSLAATMPTVLADTGLSELVIPWSEIGAVLVLALCVGVLASLWPAVRAARLPVLDAVAHD